MVIFIEDETREFECFIICPDYGEYTRRKRARIRAMTVIGTD